MKKKKKWQKKKKRKSMYWGLRTTRGIVLPSTPIIRTFITPTQFRPHVHNTPPQILSHTRFSFQRAYSSVLKVRNPVLSNSTGIAKQGL